MKLVGLQLVSVIPTYKPMDPVISRVIFGIPSPGHTFNPEPRADFAFKIPSPQLQIRKIPDPEKPTGVYQILKTPNMHNSLPSTHIDCLLHVYLCNGLNILEIKLANPNTQNIIDPGTLFMNPPKSLLSLSNVKTQHKM